MPKITYIDPSGNAHSVAGEIGATLMEMAIRYGIPGIKAECGGACSCATCHVYVDLSWTKTIGSPGPIEEDQLDFALDLRPNSRLSCQIEVTEAMDGLVVNIPERQA